MSSGCLVVGMQLISRHRVSLLSTLPQGGDVLMIWRGYGGHCLAVSEEVDVTKKHRNRRRRKKESRKTDKRPPVKQIQCVRRSLSSQNTLQSKSPEDLTLNVYSFITKYKYEAGWFLKQQQSQSSTETKQKSPLLSKTFFTNIHMRETMMMVRAEPYMVRNV